MRRRSPASELSVLERDGNAVGAGIYGGVESELSATAYPYPYRSWQRQ